MINNRFFKWILLGLLLLLPVAEGKAQSLGLSFGLGSTRKVTLVSEPEVKAWNIAVIASGSSVSAANLRAINSFVRGLKADASQVPGLSNWDCIYDLILGVGVDSLAGVFVPLKGSTVFTNGNFVSGDHNRLTGLVGNGVNKYITTSRLASTLSASDVHMAVDASNMADVGTGGFAFTGDVASAGAAHLALHNSGGRNGVAAQSYTGYLVNATNSASSFDCLVAKSATDLRYFQDGVQSGSTFTTLRTGLPTGSIDLFCFSYGVSTTKSRSGFSRMRMRLYSVGRAVAPATFYSRWATCKAALQ